MKQLANIQVLQLQDPRDLQIAFLSLFLMFGLVAAYIDVKLLDALVFLSAALVCQFIMDKFKQQKWNWKSAIITGLSLSLLLRAPTLTIVALAACIAIGSKFLFRLQGKHVFNPANIGIVVSVLLLDAWISPAQWGREPWLIFFMMGLGFIVCTRAARVDVAISFLLAYAALLFARAWFLGDEWLIPIHQMQNGALLLFAFFMITDPRTSPNHIHARYCYSLALALLAYLLQYHFYIQQGILFALVIVCIGVPVLNVVFKAESYEWFERKQQTNSIAVSFKRRSYEN